MRLEADSRRLSARQAMVIAMESNRDEISAMVDAEAQKPENIYAIIAEVQRLGDDNSSLTHFSLNMFLHDVNRRLHDLWRPLFDIMLKRTVLIRFASTSQVETQNVASKRLVHRFVPRSPFIVFCCGQQFRAEDV